MPELAHGVYSNSPTEGPFVIFPTHAHQILSNIIHLLGCSILSYCFALRTENDLFLSRNWWTNLTWARLLIIVVFLDSWFFLAFSGVLINGVGLSVSVPVCSLGIFTCIFFYAGSKGLIYLFLVERVWVVCSAGKTVTRRQSRIYHACAIIAFGYIGVIILMIVGRIAKIRQSDGACIIGLENIATIPLLTYDFFVNVLLTSLFLWYIYREQLIGIRLRRLARRTAFASVVALITSGINILVLALLRGRQLGWVCLSSCATDVTVNALVLYWVTAPPRSPPLRNSSKLPPIGVPVDPNTGCVCFRCMLIENSSNRAGEAGPNSELEVYPHQQGQPNHTSTHYHPHIQTYTCSKYNNLLNNSAWRWPWEPSLSKDVDTENNFSYDSFRNPIASYEFRFPRSFMASTTHSRNHSRSFNGFDQLPETESGFNFLGTRSRSRSLSFGRLVEEYLGKRGCEEPSHKNTASSNEEKDIADALKADVPSPRHFSLGPSRELEETSSPSIDPHEVALDIDVERNLTFPPPHNGTAISDRVSSLLEFRNELDWDSEIDPEEPDSPVTYETHKTVGSQSRLMERRGWEGDLGYPELEDNTDGGFSRENMPRRWSRPRSIQVRSSSLPALYSTSRGRGFNSETVERSVTGLRTFTSTPRLYLDSHMNHSTAFMPSTSLSAVASSSSLTATSRCSSFPLFSSHALSQTSHYLPPSTNESSKLYRTPVKFDANDDPLNHKSRPISASRSEGPSKTEKYRSDTWTLRSVDSILGLSRLFTRKIDGTGSEAVSGSHSNSNTSKKQKRLLQSSSRPSTSTSSSASTGGSRTQIERFINTSNVMANDDCCAQMHCSQLEYNSNDIGNNDIEDTTERRYQNRYWLRCQNSGLEREDMNSINVNEQMWNKTGRRLRHVRSDSWTAGIYMGGVDESRGERKKGKRVFNIDPDRSKDPDPSFRSQTPISL